MHEVEAITDFASEILIGTNSLIFIQTRFPIGRIKVFLKIYLHPKSGVLISLNFINITEFS